MSEYHHYHSGDNYADFSPPEKLYYDEIPSNPPTYIDFDEYGSLWSKIAALLWIATVVFWLFVHSKHEEEQERRAEEQRAEELHQAKRKSMLEPDRRRIVISETISSRIMKDDDLKGHEATTTTATNTTSETSESHNADVENGECTNSGVDDIGSMHNTPPSECSICLERFEPGEQLSWSKDLKCHHIFHTDCLQPWLMTNDDCPCCRTLFFDEFDFVKRGLISQKGKLSKLPDYSTSDGEHLSMDNSSGMDGSARFRIVNGLVSIVRNVRDGLSGSESNRGNFSSSTTNSSATHTPLAAADHDDLAESQPSRSNKNDSNDDTSSLEMVSMVPKTKSDEVSINNNHDQEQHDRSHNKKKKRKGRGKQRYSALANDSDESDDDQDIGVTSEINVDNYDEDFDDNQRVESDDIV